MPEMKKEEFVQWQALLEQRTGLWLPESRKAFLIAALNRHLKEKQIKNYQELYTRLASGQISALDWASLIDSLTVNETCFYREQNSLNIVNSFCRNRALEGFKKNPEKAQHFQIWSVGCATGEEAYSLAMEMDKLNHGLKESSGKTVYYGVTGVDISFPALAVAREGIYLSRQLDFVPQVTKNVYFNKLADNHYQIKDNIRQRTCFIQNNILELDRKRKQEFDIIYCQNVLIYFKQERKQKVVAQLAERLKPGGLLVLGHGEVTNIDCEELTRVDNKHCLAYLRKDD